MLDEKYTLKLMPQAGRDIDDAFTYISYELKNISAATRIIVISIYSK